MKSNIKAFFYQYKYYLLPESVNSVKELEIDTPLLVKCLNEKLCMAPNFVYESITEETLVISEPEKAFDTEVNLYTSKEYDDQLRVAVNRVCPGCQRYTDDGSDDLNGHHREIDLDGCCYEREEEGAERSFALCTDIFWYRMSEKIDELAACIDTDDQEKLNSIINGQLEQFFTATRVLGTYEDEKYHLYFSNPFHMEPLVSYMLTYITQFTDKCEYSIHEWEICSFIPAGVLTPSDDQYDLDNSAFFFTEDEKTGNFVVGLAGQSYADLSEDAQGELFDSLYDKLCYRLGENVLSGTVCGFDILPSAERTVSLEELEALLKSRYDSDVAENNGVKPSIPPAIAYSLVGDAEAEKNLAVFLPYREYVTEGFSAVPKLSCLFMQDLEDEMPWWTNFVSYCYLYLPCSDEEAPERMNVLLWYLSNRELIPKPIRSDEVRPPAGASIGFAVCEGHGIILDSVIMDEPLFFDILRRTAPVLRAYGAKAVFVNSEGIHVYECRNHMEKIEYKR